MNQGARDANESMHRRSVENTLDAISEKLSKLIALHTGGQPYCPDCIEAMVPAGWQTEENEWVRVWICKCKVDPPEEEDEPS